MDPTPAGPFVVLTHNIGNGLAPPAKLIPVLRAAQADLIGLQEITAEQAAAITRDLADLYPYQIVHGEGIPGKGILSKFPIHTIERLHFYPERPDLRAIVTLPEGDLLVIVAHPRPPTLGRRGFAMSDLSRRQIARLVAHASTGAPALLLGDFNLSPRHPFYRGLQKRGWVDAFAAAGQGAGLTLPTRYLALPLVPFLRVDYIWHTAHLRAVDAWVGPATGSDHLPVLARLAWVASAPL